MKPTSTPASKARSGFIAILTLGLPAVFMVAPAAFAAPAQSDTPTAQPNIIVILADDLGYGDVHALNPERGKIPTPCMDKLASEGMILTDAHASSSAVSPPSRYALLTGRYNWRSQLQTGIVPQWGAALIAKDRLTLPAMLKRQGYDTACFGKWHLGWNRPKTATI